MTQLLRFLLLTLTAVPTDTEPTSLRVDFAQPDGTWAMPALALGQARGVALAAAALATGTPWAPTLAPLTWASLFFQVVIVTFASYLLWFWLIRHYPATKLASFTLLTPVFGLVLGALLLGEPITLRLVVAAAAVGFGILVVNRR